jgi:hypothetical protein
MLIQIGLEGKTFAAARAPEVLGRGVGLQVRAQIAPIRE